MIVPDVIVHRSVDLTPHDCTWFEGIPVTTPERTLCDLGLVFPETEVMRILRHAVATGVVSRRDVWMIRRRISKSGRDGAGVIGRCLDALPDLAEYTESGLEVTFLEMCADFGAPEPSIQLAIVVGGRTYRVDFAYPRQRVFVEVDGRRSQSEPDQIANDGDRQNTVVAAGWQPLRFMYEALRQDPAGCAQTLEAALRF